MRRADASRRSRESYESDASPMASMLLSLGNAIENIAKQRQRGRLGERRPSTFLPGRAGFGTAPKGDAAAALAAAAAAAPDRSGGGGTLTEEVRWSEAVDHMRVMLSSHTRAVRLRAATTLSVLAECSRSAKDEILKTNEVMGRLISIMRAGGLEAIAAIAVLTTDSEIACDQARELGAIATLAAFIVRVGEEDAAPDSSPNSGAAAAGAGPAAAAAAAAAGAAAARGGGHPGAEAAMAGAGDAAGDGSGAPHGDGVQLRRSALGFAPKASLLHGDGRVMATGAEAACADAATIGRAAHAIGAVAAAQRASRKLKSATKKGKAGKAKAAAASSRVPAAASLPIGELFSR